MPFYLENDFAVSPSGTLREATPTESIRQDVAHMLEESDDLAEPGTAVFENSVRSAILSLLDDHPGVHSKEGVDVTPNETNTCDVSIFVNGDPAAIQIQNVGGT